MQEQGQLHKAADLLTKNQVQSALSILSSLAEHNWHKPHIIRSISLLLAKFSRVEAKPYFERCIELKNDDSQLHFLYAMYLQALNQNEEAQYHFKQSLKIDSRDLDCLFNYSQFLWKNEDKEQALSTLGKCVSGSPEHPVYSLTYANFLASLGRTEEAIRYFSISLPRIKGCEENNSVSRSMHFSSLVNYCVCLLQVYDYNKLLEVSEKVLQLEPTKVQGYYYRGLALDEIGRYEQAKAAYLKYLNQQDGSNIQMRRRVARILLKMGDKQGANKFLQECLEISPNHSDISYDYAVILSQQGKTKQAIPVLEQLCEQDPSSTKSLNLLAHCLALEGQLQKADIIYDKYLRLQPTDTDTQKRYANLLLNMEQYQRCYDRVLEGLLQECSNDPEVLTMSGVYFVNMGCYQDAQIMFKNSLAINGALHETWYQYAALLYNMEKYSQAHDAIGQAVRREPMNPTYHLLKGIIILKMQNRDPLEVVQTFSSAQKCIQQIQQRNHKGTAQQNPHQNYSHQLSEAQLKYIRENLQLYDKILKKRISHPASQSNQEEQAEEVKKISDKMADLLGESIHVKNDNHGGVGGKDMRESYALRRTATLANYKTVKKNTGANDADLNWEKKMESLRKEMMRQMEKMRKENIQLHRNTSQRLDIVEEEAKQMREKLLWDRRFQEQLNILNVEKRFRCNAYGRKLCWMLCTAIHAYRSLKLGILKAGDDAILSKSGKFIQQVGSACDLGKDLPGIGGIFSFIAAVAVVYTDLERDIVIEKIVFATNNFYQESYLGRAVTEAVEILITDPRHLLLVENPKQDEWYEMILNDISDRTHSLMSDFKGIKLDEDEKQAMVDCGRIMGKLLQIKDPSNEKNPIRIAANEMMKQKIAQAETLNKNKQRTPPIIEKTGCCGTDDSCRLM